MMSVACPPDLPDYYERYRSQSVDDQIMLLSVEEVEILSDPVHDQALDWSINCPKNRSVLQTNRSL